MGLNVCCRQVVLWNVNCGPVCRNLVCRVDCMVTLDRLGWVLEDNEWALYGVDSVVTIDRLYCVLEGGEWPLVWSWLGGHCGQVVLCARGRWVTLSVCRRVHGHWPGVWEARDPGAGAEGRAGEHQRLRTEGGPTAAGEGKLQLQLLQLQLLQLQQQLQLQKLPQLQQLLQLGYIYSSYYDYSSCCGYSSCCNYSSYSNNKHFFTLWLLCGLLVYS